MSRMERKEQEVTKKSKGRKARFEEKFNEQEGVGRAAAKANVMMRLRVLLYDLRFLDSIFIFVSSLILVAETTFSSSMRTELSSKPSRNSRIFTSI